MERRGSFGKNPRYRLIFPGINRLDYDCEFEGGFFPCHIESCTDAGIADWLERVIHMVPVAQRPEGYSPLGEKCLASEWTLRLSESGKNCFHAILAKDITKLGAAMNETMLCWEALLPHTVAHPSITVDLVGLLSYYRSAMQARCVRDAAEGISMSYPKKRYRGQSSWISAAGTSQPLRAATRQRLR
jgi:hypothetical protein